MDNQIVWHEQYSVWSTKLGTAFTLQVHWESGKGGQTGKYHVTVTGGGNILRAKVGYDTPAEAQAAAIRIARLELQKALALLGPATPTAAE